MNTTELISFIKSDYMVFEDDFELEKEINDAINEALLQIRMKYNINFTEANLEWDYAQNLYDK